MKFQCDGCGLCCHKLKYIFEKKDIFWFKKLIEAFPYKYDDTGKCEMLDKNNKCKVYNNRPDLCNVEKMFKLQTTLVNKKVWFNVNKRGCKLLKDENKNTGT